uniref:Uncharacterized protein n=1 Tax=viral metagenome TaxID=1070528 RepID=A0A6M3J0C9_9ZZZZ
MKPYFETDSGVIYQGHVLEILKEIASESVNCVVIFEEVNYGLLNISLGTFFR